jgi:chromosome segregation ATPase
MPETVTNELIFEVLKKVQQDVGDMRREVGDVRLRTERLEEQLGSMRHILVAMQTGDLHQEARIAELRVDVDAIKQHLTIKH